MAVGCLTGLSAGDATTVRQSLGYQFDVADRIQRITHGLDPNLTHAFEYDALDRLTSSTTPSVRASYGYDAVGNRTSHSVDGQATHYGIAPDSNRTLSMGGSDPRHYVFNANGNVMRWTGEGGVDSAVSYDAFNRLSVHERAGVRTTYEIDAADQRIGKSGAATGTRRFVHDGTRLLAELGPTGGWKNYLWLGSELVGVVSDRLYAVHADHLGRPAMVTDGGRTPVWRAWNWDFHRTVVQDQIGGLNIGFPGQYHDAESGLWHNGFRDYLPEGRYLQTDPIGLVGGLNTYMYAMGNPVNAVDSLGLQTCLLTTVGPGGVRDHAAVFTTRGDGTGGPALYDPAGSYGAVNGGGSGGIVTGDAASIAKFTAFHNGQQVEATCRDTSKKEEEGIINKAMNLPSAAPFECAEMSSSALSEQPSFPYVEAGTFFPGNLLRQVRRGP